MEQRRILVILFALLFVLISGMILIESDITGQAVLEYQEGEPSFSEERARLVDAWNLHLSSESDSKIHDLVDIRIQFVDLCSNQRDNMECDRDLEMMAETIEILRNADKESDFLDEVKYLI